MTSLNEAALVVIATNQKAVAARAVHCLVCPLAVPKLARNVFGKASHSSTHQEELPDDIFNN
jgi:hypothetical protein